MRSPASSQPRMATTLTMVLAAFGLIFIAMGADDAVKDRHPAADSSRAKPAAPAAKATASPRAPNPIYGEPMAPGMVTLLQGEIARRFAAGAWTAVSPASRAMPASGSI